MLLLELIMMNLSPISTANPYFELCNHNHTKTSIIFSQALRMRRICSERSDLVDNVRKFRYWFREKGCVQDMVNKETKRALETKKTLESLGTGSGKKAMYRIWSTRKQRGLLKLLH